MKRVVLLAYICFLAASCRKDLVRWSLVQPLTSHTTTDRLEKILFVNDTLGFVVGGARFSHSTILRTTDGGNTWEYQNIAAAPKALYNITQASSGVLYAIGFDGKLLQSADGGQTWQYHQLWYLPYKDLAFFNANSGIAIGGISFYSGCKTEIDRLGNFGNWDSLGYELNEIEMIDSLHGYIAGYGLIMKTNNGGKKWEIQDAANDNFTAVRAYGLNEAWACGYNGSIFHTSNGGASWQRMRDGNDFTRPRYRLLDICFTNAHVGYAVGENGLLIYTDDGGRHWMELEKFTNHTLRSIAPMADGSLMVCGDGGSLYRVRAKGL